MLTFVSKFFFQGESCKTPIPLAERMRHFAFSVISITVLGIEANNLYKLFSDFEIWTKALFSIPFAFTGSPFAKAIKAKKLLFDPKYSRFRNLAA